MTEARTLSARSFARRLCWTLAWLLAGCLAITAAQAAELRITFRLSAPNLDEDAAVFIAGGAQELGNWRPDGVRMDHAGDHVWTANVTFTTQASVEYKYTLGRWEEEGADATGAPLGNFVARLKDGMVLEDSVTFWTADVVRHPPQGQVTGEVVITRGLEGAGILPRDMLVWLPPGYREDTERRYPVLYMHDGQNLFDPVTSSFGVDWSVDESVDRLIREGVIEPMIVVGLTSTANRSPEYSPGPEGVAYMNFLVNTVKPLIDTRYRTLAGRQHTLVGGSSMGGLISLALAWEHPDVFGAAICMSPAIMVEGQLDTLPYFSRGKGQRREVFLYFDNGGIGLEERLQPGLDLLLSALDEWGYRRDEDYVFVLDPDARHFEGAWAERFPEALVMALRGAARQP